MASLITCRKCGTENAADSRYCDQCSAPLQAMPPIGTATTGLAATVDLRAAGPVGTASHPHASLPAAAPALSSGRSTPPSDPATVPLDSTGLPAGPASARVPSRAGGAAPTTTPVWTMPAPAVVSHVPVRRNNSGLLIIGGIVLALIIFLGALASLAGHVINVPPTAIVAPTANISALVAAALVAHDATTEAHLNATQTALPQDAVGDAGRATAQAVATIEHATAGVMSADNDHATQAAQTAGVAAAANAAGATGTAAGGATATAGAAQAAQQATQAAQQTAQQAAQATGTAVAAADAGQADARKTATAAVGSTRTAAALLVAQQAVTRTALAALSGAQAATAGAAATKTTVQQAADTATQLAQQATATAAQAAQQATAAAAQAAQQATAGAAQLAQQGTATAGALQAATQQAAITGTAAAHSGGQTATAAVPVAWAPHNVRFFASAVPGCAAAPAGNFNYPQAVFVQVAMDDAPAGTRVDVIWSGGDKAYTHTDTQTATAEVRPACFDGYSLDPSRAAIGPGTYEVSLRINSDTLKTITVQIAGPPATPTAAVWTPHNVRAFTAAAPGCAAAAQTTFDYPAVVYFHLAMDDAPAGTKIEVAWSGGFNNYVHSDSQTNANEIRPACYEGFSLDTGRARIGPGTYTLAVQINGTVVKTLQIIVNGPPPSATPGAVPPTPVHPTATPAPIPPSATTAPVAPTPTSAPAHTPHIYEVEIKSSGFSPHDIEEAHVGDSVRFTNTTAQTQITVVINTPSGPVENGVAKGDSWDYTFTAPGTYHYFNKFNGGQTGMVVVSP